MNIFTRIMVTVINIADKWLYFTVQPTKSARLESWAHDKGWLEMWAGRKEHIEYYRQHKAELEEYWDDTIGCIIREKTRLHFENMDLRQENERLRREANLLLTTPPP